MDYELLVKMKVEKLKNYLKIPDLKVAGKKKELVARVFATSENGVKPVKTVELESNVVTGYRNKLKIDDFPMPDSFKKPHEWMEEDEEMEFWPMLSNPDIFFFMN